MTLFSPLTLPWDLAVLALLFLGSIVTLLAWRKCKSATKKWKKFLAYSICGSLAVSTFIIFEASFIEPQRIVVTRGEVALGLSEPLTIAVVSDFHVGPYKGAWFVSRAVKRINALKPDVVLLVGDFVLDEEISASGLVPLAALKNIQSTFGTFAVTGNHDHGVFRYFDFIQITRADHADQLTEYLRSLGITVLVNQHVSISTKGGNVAIAGMIDAWSGKADILATLAGASSPTILLAHNPDVILDPATHAADLVVSGHTHGGQIRLPWIGPLTKLPIRIDQSYDQGIFRLKSGNTLAITRGIGESGPRARLFAPPEILLLTAK